MAHFAELDSGGVVVRVLAVANDVTTTDGVEVEQDGIDYMTGLFPGTTWVQTSYNGRQRRAFAGPGDIYDAAADVFHSPQPFPSWTLDSNHVWQPPTPHPGIADGLRKWDEASTSWVTGDA